MRSLEAAVGFTAADFLQRAVNNLCWWPFEYHVTYAEQSIISAWHIETALARSALASLIVMAFAIGLTAVSVVAFVLNRRSWERYLVKHADVMPSTCQSSTVTLDQNEQSYHMARSFLEHSFVEEGVSYGPRPQV